MSVKFLVRYSVSALCVLLALNGTSSFAGIDEEKEYYAQMSLDGYLLRVDSEAVSLIVELARFRGRRLTPDEVYDLLHQILKVSGGSLVKALREEDAERSPMGFVPETRLKTPTGDRSIGSLGRGDIIFSVDVRTGRYIRNEVDQITKIGNQSVSRFHFYEPMSAITVVSDQPFFSLELNDYVSLRSLNDTSRLMKLRSGNSRFALLTQVRRGPLLKLSEPRLVYGIQLKFPPYNFCVNSLVVLDKKFDSKYARARSTLGQRLKKRINFNLEAPGK